MLIIMIYHVYIIHTYGQVHMDIIQVLIDTVYFYWSTVPSTFQKLFEWFETASSIKTNIIDLHPHHQRWFLHTIYIHYSKQKCIWTDLPTQKPNSSMFHTFSHHCSIPNPCCHTGGPGRHLALVPSVPSNLNWLHSVHLNRCFQESMFNDFEKTHM